MRTDRITWAGQARSWQHQIRYASRQWSKRLYNSQPAGRDRKASLRPQRTPRNPRPMTEFVAESADTVQPSPVRRKLALRVRIIPNSQKYFFAQKIDSALQQSYVPGRFVMRRHCGSRKANGQAPRSLARRWLGSRYASSQRRALTSSHVLAVLVPAALRNPHISREERST